MIRPIYVIRTSMFANTNGSNISLVFIYKDDIVKCFTSREDDKKVFIKFHSAYTSVKN
jgi:hypothetical protein